MNSLDIAHAELLCHYPLKSFLLILSSIIHANPSFDTAIPEIQDETYKNLMGALLALGYLSPRIPRGFRKPKTGIEIGRNGARKRLLCFYRKTRENGQKKVFGHCNPFFMLTSRPNLKRVIPEAL